MPIAMFSKEDLLPALREPEFVWAEKTFDVELLRGMTGLSRIEISRRFMERNDAWILWVDKVPAAFGWVARWFAPVGELERIISLPRKQVYLWNFRTVEALRGSGYYPMLLQAIIKAEIKMGTEKLWILAKPENKSSFRGMVKAGFRISGEPGFNDSNDLVLLPVESGMAADEASAFLNIPVANAEIKPCWCCNSNSMGHAKGECGCMCDEPEEAACIC